jgi:hypothetical protein
MKIDDRSKAIALTEKLKASLPIKVRPGKQFLQMLRQQGEIANPDREYEVSSVIYSGDEGGISCGLMSQPTDKRDYIVSITHLEVDSNHPLATELKEYQSQRTRKLFIQNKGGFSAEFLADKSIKNRKRSSGFGK